VTIDNQKRLTFFARSMRVKKFIAASLEQPNFGGQQRQYRQWIKAVNTCYIRKKIYKREAILSSNKEKHLNALAAELHAKLVKDGMSDEQAMQEIFRIVERGAKRQGTGRQQSTAKPEPR
jgi:hypothetical protein